MDFNDCPCSGRTIGRLVQPAVMAALAAEPLHGYLIVQRVAQLAMFKDGPPDPTGVYRILKSMEDDKLVVSTWDLADNGPARRRFELTPAGKDCLGRWTKTLGDYEEAVADLLARIRQASRKPRRAKA